VTIQIIRLCVIEGGAWGVEIRHSVPQLPGHTAQTPLECVCRAWMEVSALLEFVQMIIDVWSV